MQTFSQEEIEKGYDKLPEILKDAMYSPDVAIKVVAIGKKFGLTIEKIGSAAEQTGYVVLGLVRPSEFTQALVDVLEIGADKARELAKEINSQIFYPLREALKAAHQMEITEPEVTKAPMTTVPTTSPRPTAPTPPQPKAETPLTPKPSIPQQPPKPPIPEPRIMNHALGEPTRPVAPINPPKAAPPVFSPLPKVAPAAPPAGEVKTVPPSPRPVEPIRPPEHIRPPALTPKVPPLDLRKSKPERMREAIFAPPVESQTTVPAEPKKGSPPSAPKEIGGAARLPEKKTPYDGYDPYKEPTE